MWEDILPEIAFSNFVRNPSRDPQLRELLGDPAWSLNPKFRRPGSDAGVPYGAVPLSDKTESMIPQRPLSPFVDRGKFSIGSQVNSPLPEVVPQPPPSEMLDEQMARARQIQQQPTGGELWQRPASAAPWYQGTLNDISGYSQGASSGSAVASALDQVLAKQPPTLDGSVTGARPYNPLDTGLTPSPYAVTDNLMERGPVHTLGVNGFRTGWSRPTVDYSGMMERSRADNHNMRIAEMLGRQEMARNAQGNENLRTMMALQQRDDAAKAMAESRYFGNLNRVPEGKRTPLINEGLSKQHLDPTVGNEMLLDEMLTRARMNAKTGSGIDLKRLLGSVASEFDPNKLSRSDLISKLQRMGYTADQIAALESDPTVGQFAGSLLNPDPNPKEPPLKFLGLPLFGKASRQLWEW